MAGDVLAQGSYQYSAGVKTMRKSLTIPARRADIRPGLRPPYAADKYCQPAGQLYGKGRNSTILDFQNSITGSLIQSENFGSSLAGQYWNNANTQGNTSQKSFLCGGMYDLGVNGGAVLRPTAANYTDGRTTDPTKPTRGQYAYSNPSGQPDLIGPDFPVRADGLSVSGGGFIGERLKFFSIPGYAIKAMHGNGPQAGVFGYSDDFGHRFHEIKINECFAGIFCQMSDSKLSDIYIDGCVTDGVTLHNATILNEAHVTGCDRGLVFNLPSKAFAVTTDGCRIGAHIVPGADGAKIDGLDIVQVCYYRGALIEASGVRVTNLTGCVRAPDATWPDIAGFEMASGIVHCYIEGDMVPFGAGISGIVRGHRNEIRLRGGPVSSSPLCTHLKIAEAITQTIIVAQCIASANCCAVDASQSGLNVVNGKGNKFDIYATTNGQRIRYPGYGTAANPNNLYNLAEGNYVWFDGERQTTGMPG